MARRRRPGEERPLSTSCGWEITYAYRTCRCCCTPISLWVCSKNVKELPFSPMAGCLRTWLTHCLRACSFSLRGDMSGLTHAPTWVFLPPIHMTSLLHSRLTGFLEHYHLCWFLQAMLHPQPALDFPKASWRAWILRFWRSSGSITALRRSKWCLLKRLGSVAEFFVNMKHWNSPAIFDAMTTFFHTLGIQSPKLTMVSYNKYYAFRRWKGTPQSSFQNMTIDAWG